MIFCNFEMPNFIVNICNAVFTLALGILNVIILIKISKSDRKFENKKIINNNKKNWYSAFNVEEKTSNFISESNGFFEKMIQAINTKDKNLILEEKDNLQSCFTTFHKSISQLVSIVEEVEKAKEINQSFLDCEEIISKNITFLLCNQKDDNPCIKNEIKFEYDGFKSKVLKLIASIILPD